MYTSTTISVGTRHKALRPMAHGHVVASSCKWRGWLTLPPPPSEENDCLILQVKGWLPPLSKRKGGYLSSGPSGMAHGTWHMAHGTQAFWTYIYLSLSVDIHIKIQRHSGVRQPGLWHLGLRPPGLRHYLYRFVCTYIYPCLSSLSISICFYFIYICIEIYRYR